MGHPSVCSSIRRTRSGEGTDPWSSRSSAASSASKTRSVVPISSTSPRTSPTAAGEPHLPATRRRPAGPDQAGDRGAGPPRHGSRVTGSRRNGPTRPRAARRPHRSRPPTPARPDRVRRRLAKPVHGRWRRRALAPASPRRRSMPSASTTSSSARSNDTQATARSSCSSQSTSSVVLPYPTGADTTTRGDPHWRRASSSRRGRRTSHRAHARNTGLRSRRGPGEHRLRRSRCPWSRHTVVGTRRDVAGGVVPDIEAPSVDDLFRDRGRSAPGRRRRHR